MEGIVINPLPFRKFIVFLCKKTSGNIQMLLFFVKLPPFKSLDLMLEYFNTQKVRLILFIIVRIIKNYCIWRHLGGLAP